ncbi:MAG: hypothetical protein MI757_04375, partial [Pirellulales bacterium]|nr:hypothetical protein [Pirellulales bacterium]
RLLQDSCAAINRVEALLSPIRPKFGTTIQRRLATRDHKPLRQRELQLSVASHLALTEPRLALQCRDLCGL